MKLRLTFLEDITLDDSHFENLEEGDPISPLEDDIGDYFHIENEKWEIVGPQFDSAPIYDTNREDEAKIGLRFLSSIIYDDISIDRLGKENFFFPLDKEGQLEVINFLLGETQYLILRKSIRLPHLLSMILYSNHLSL